MDYPIYTTEYDEVIRPLDIASEEELAGLSTMFHELCPVEDFEPLRERLESLRKPDFDAVVTLLVDNSGSMRAPRVTFAVGAVGIISMYLDRLGIRNEILGYTTKTWNGGQAAEDYRNAGYTPKNPGRLDCLRHIVYKDVTEQLQDVRNNLALMFKEGLLKENIDGEALLWAAERLRSYDAEKRILLVLSDGAPCADRTSLYNQNLPADEEQEHIRTHSLLKKHLMHVIKELTEAGDITLDAIGINFDVSQYYDTGTEISSLKDLAPVAIGKLEQLLNNLTDHDAPVSLGTLTNPRDLKVMDATLDEVSKMAANLPHLVHPMFLPAIEGLKTSVRLESGIISLKAED